MHKYSLSVDVTLRFYDGIFLFFLFVLLVKPAHQETHVRPSFIMVVLT